jgi:hypothetical protein
MDKTSSRLHEAGHVLALVLLPIADRTLRHEKFLKQPCVLFFGLLQHLAHPSRTQKNGANTPGVGGGTPRQVEHWGS